MHSLMYTIDSSDVGLELLLVVNPYFGSQESSYIVVLHLWQIFIMFSGVNFTNVFARVFRTNKAKRN